MRRRLWALLAALAACGCGSKSDAESRGEAAGKALAVTLARAVKSRGNLAAPHRCGRLDRPPRPGPELAVPGRQVARDGRSLDLGSRDRRLVVGAVADARGASKRTLANIERVTAAFAEAGVEVVLSLGGMGREQDELAAVLAALARGGDWLVVALPGDRESVPAHRGAVAEVAARGLAVVDGAELRLVAADGAVVGTLPGVAEPGQLVAGAEGCVHAVADAAALAEQLAAREGPRLWAGYAAPRQWRAGASDLVDGVHIGELELGAPLAQSKADVVIHGQVDDAAFGPAQGAAGIGGDARAVLGTGALEAIPAVDWQGEAIAGAALIATVEGRRVRWQRVRLPVQ